VTATSASQIDALLAAGAEAPLGAAAAHALSGLDVPLEPLLAAAATRRGRRRGRRVTFSPKVFLPLTNLCRDVCDYCTFRRSPKDEGAHTMSPDEVRSQLERARKHGCTEALFCLGDRPEAVFPSYRRQLAAWGFSSTVDYLRWAGQLALDLGLLPHTNAGVLTLEELAILRPVNASMGLMLESSSDRLCGKGQAHHRAPDKRPAVRMAMTRDAGVLAIPFTSGLLMGIGETIEERVDTLLAIRDLHREHHHVQEVIVQRFRAHEGTPMEAAPEPLDEECARAIALARLILDDEVSVQAPPNLSPGAIELLLAAGLDDWGGISPLTPDFINPGHHWPHIARLAERCAAAGHDLERRLPVHDAWLTPAFVDPSLFPVIDEVRHRTGAARAA
jgi:7,8-didemethyl-8-hydroxy-5-deazariboflavin synthase CofG subunit